MTENEKGIPTEISALSELFIASILAVSASFSLKENWAAELMNTSLGKDYLRIISLIVANTPTLENCLVICKRCSIPFITHPSNAGRKDLNCCFGCREFLRQQNANNRSRRFYTNREGKEKKRIANQKRYLINPATPTEFSISVSVENLDGKSLFADENVFGKSQNVITSYLKALITLIEGRQISTEEIERILEKIQRQRPLDADESKVYYDEYSNLNSS
ncbi:MAG: hypothetical protein HQM10_27015 [Candidatus Riflebacteria bacterium]|nr:hypothetical protein [Candidatus Riflebacteria bacterium]